MPVAAMTRSAGRCRRSCSSAGQLREPHRLDQLAGPTITAAVQLLAGVGRRTAELCSIGLLEQGLRHCVLQRPRPGRIPSRVVGVEQLLTRDARTSPKGPATQVIDNDDIRVPSAKRSSPANIIPVGPLPTTTTSCKGRHEFWPHRVVVGLDVRLAIAEHPHAELGELLRITTIGAEQGCSRQVGQEL